MFTKKEIGLARAVADPFDMLREMTSEFDRMVAQGKFRWPMFGNRNAATYITWYPEIDVVERGNRLVTKVDLPGMKKEDVKVEVVDGQLTIAGERKTEAEEKNEHFYRCEREYGGFYRAIPLPPGVSLETITATFADGVLEVSMPLPPAAAEAKAKTITIDGPATAAKTAA